MARGELIELVSSLGRDLDWRLNVDQEDIADAYILMLKVLRLKRLDQHSKLIETRAGHASFFRHLDKETKLLIAKKIKEVYNRAFNYSIKRFYFKPIKDAYCALSWRGDVPVVELWCNNCGNLAHTVDAVDLIDGGELAVQCPHCKTQIRAEVKVEIEELSEELVNFLKRCLRKYPWLRYAAYVPIFTKYSLIALVFDPPEVVYRKDIKATSWANYFIPHTYRKKQKQRGKEVEVEVIHKPLAAKFFYTFTRLKVAYDVVSVDKVRKQIEKMYGKERLLDWFENQYRKHYGKYQNKARAAANTYRDLLRICELNVYLVYSYLAHRQGLIQAVHLPYELAKMPGNCSTYFNPIDTVHKTYTRACSNAIGVDLKDITWVWAVSTCGIKVG